MALDLTNKVASFLKDNKEKKFTARDIANWMFETHPAECREKQERSTAIITPLDGDDKLIQQLVADIGSRRPQLQRMYPEIKTTEEHPRKYYYTDSTDDAEIDKAESTTTSTDTSEHDLYPVLTEYLWSELNIYSLRIDEKRSTKSKGPGGNKWLFPDIVGMEDLGNGWIPEMKEFVKLYNDNISNLWSFEVKKLINRANVRETFFQAVSNSTWANYGYLVASDVEGSDTTKELRMLASLHGIGFIRLNTENPSESQIMIPAKERGEVDWDTANRLNKENTDFQEYIKLIRQFYQTGETKTSDWGMEVED